jgi:hypothetical protein
MTTLSACLTVLTAGLLMTACNAQVVCEQSSCGDSDTSAGSADDPAEGSADDPAEGSADDPAEGSADDPAEGGPMHAPVEGVACDFENPAWMSYVISAADMASGASNSTGAGRCEGWVIFKPETITFNMWDAETKTVVQGTANGSTWYGEDCGTPHCGTLYYGDGSMKEEYCTIFAVCENGVAQSVGYTW